MFNSRRQEQLADSDHIQASTQRHMQLSINVKEMFVTNMYSVTNWTFAVFMAQLPVQAWKERQPTLRK